MELVRLRSYDLTELTGQLLNVNRQNVYANEVLMKFRFDFFSIRFQKFRKLTLFSPSVGYSKNISLLWTHKETIWERGSVCYYTGEFLHDIKMSVFPPNVPWLMRNRIFWKSLTRYECFHCLHFPHEFIPATRAIWCPWSTGPGPSLGWCCESSLNSMPCLSTSKSPTSSAALW